MPKVLFLNTGFDHYNCWIHHDRKMLDKVIRLLEDIDRNGADKGIGKPERLKHQPGWSRRIDQEHRLIYEVTQDKIIKVKSCRGHYDDD